MRNFILLVAVFMLLGSVFPQTDIGIVGPLTSSAFACLKNVVSPAEGYYMRVYVRAYHSIYQPAGLDVNAQSTLISASKANLYPGFYIELNRQGDPIAQVEAVYQLFESIVDGGLVTATGYIKRIVLKLQKSENPEWSWEGYTHKQNCDFLNTTLRFFTTKGADLKFFQRVFTTASFWAEHFGNECANIATQTATRLSYAHYQANGQLNSQPNKDDFTPFGGWTSEYGSVFQKQIYGNQTVALTCLAVGDIVPTARVDLYKYLL